MADFATRPVPPMPITLDVQNGDMRPGGPTQIRRMSDLPGLFQDTDTWRRAVDANDPVVYEVAFAPVPEADRELPQSITTIYPGDVGGEFHMTKGHQHPNPQGEIYLGLSGVGGLLLFDGDTPQWIEMSGGTIGYIPPRWAHRSVNTGDRPYRFLAVYPGNAGHDYQWVRDHGMGYRVLRGNNAPQLVGF